MDNLNGSPARMMLADLPTPCLVLDRAILERNLRDMAATLRTFLWQVGGSQQIAAILAGGAHVDQSC